MEKINLFLVIGVIFATTMSGMLALLFARRLLDPIRSLTLSSQEISRTRNLDVGFPQLKGDDEFAELSATLDEMIESLERSRDDLQHSLTRQKELVADASHELRTPLTSIITNLDILADDLSGEDQQLARRAKTSAKRMQAIIEDLLLLARSDRSQNPIQLSTIDLSQAAQIAISELSNELANHNFQQSLKSPLPVQGNSEELQRLVVNLLANAARHSPPGSQIVCRTQIFNPETALLTVADDGPGIAPEEQAKVFERFYRIGGDQGRSGSGLGLAIVQTIVEDHNGRIELGEGISGRGAAFHVFLPLARGQ